MKNNSKYSKSELKRLIEEAVCNEYLTDRKGLWFCVDEVESTGMPISTLKIWGTLHFLAEGSPFCCDEPNCHIGTNDDLKKTISKHLMSSMNIQHIIDVKVMNINANHHNGTNIAGSK